MDTEGPISVLDRRTRSSSRDRVVSDRITRRRSPGPHCSRADRAGSRTSLNSSGSMSLNTSMDASNPDENDVVYRIAQPYRTSFSAKHSVTWGKPDRSRSLSPLSLRSEVSVGCRSLHSALGERRRPRDRSKSPKRVTYDNRVTVRHSDTEDSMFTELSSHDYVDDDSPMRPITNPFSRSLISPKYNEFSHIPNPNPSASSSFLQQKQQQHMQRQQQKQNKMKARYRDHRTMARDLNNAKKSSSNTNGTNDTSTSVLSNDSGLDYSTEIKDLSNQIMTMDWSPRQGRALKSRPPPLSSPTHHPHRQPHTQLHQQHHRRGSSSSSSAPSMSGGILKDSQNSRVSGNSPTADLITGDSQFGTITTGNGSVSDRSTIGGRDSTSGAGYSSSSPHPSSPTETWSASDDYYGKENDPTRSPDRHPHHHQHHQHHQPQQRQQHPQRQQPLSTLEDSNNKTQQQQQQRMDEAGIRSEKSDEDLKDGGSRPTAKDYNRKTRPGSGCESSPGGSTGDASPGRDSPSESGRLTPSKRSFSLSITNFLKRFSPHVRRKKSSRDRGSKSSSAAGSAQSLETGNGTVSDGSDPGRSSNDNAATANSTSRHGRKGKRRTTTAAGGDGATVGDSGQGHFSRSKVRQSLMKLVRRSSSRKKPKNGKSNGQDDHMIPTPSHYTIELQDPDRTLSSDEVDEIINTMVISNTDHNNTASNSNGKPAFNPSTSRIMKSIEDNKVGEQDIYKKFKERNSPKTNEERNNLHSCSPLTTVAADHHKPSTSFTHSTPKPFYYSPSSSSSFDPRAKFMAGDPSSSSHPHSYSSHSLSNGDHNDISMEFFTETDLKAILNPHLKQEDSPDWNSNSYVGVGNGNSTGGNHERSIGAGVNSRVIPPSSLDVMPSRSVKLLQTSVISNISGDESIGECSLDANLTASEPSLLNSQHTTNGNGSQSNPSSRYVHVPQSLVNSTTTDGVITSPGQDGALVEVKLRRPKPKENNSLSGSDSGPPSPSSAHTPSYLKLACAVSGYGRYCRYSTYKDVNKPSPYSSQNSLRSGGTSPEPGMPAERKSGDELSSPEHHSSSISSSNCTSPSSGWRKSKDMNGTNGQLDGPSSSVLNGLSGQKYPTGDIMKDGEYFLQHAQFEDDRLRGLASRAEAMMRSQDIPDEACGVIRSAIGKANLLVTQKFLQFRILCGSHMQPDPEERETKWEDLQGFWDMIKIQVDNCDDMFAEIELMRSNGWQEIPRLVPSRRSSASSSPKSANVSQASTPSATPAHTPGTKRKNLIANNKKDTPESSPERTQKARHAAKVRDDARRKLLAEKRAAMRQQQVQSNGGGNSSNSEVEIYLPDADKK